MASALRARHTGNTAAENVDEDSEPEVLDDDEQQAVIASLESQAHKFSIIHRALLGFVAFGMFAFVTHFLVTTRLDPREMVTEYGLAMSMTRRSCVFSYMGMGLAYALAGCSFAGFLPRITSKAACVIGLLPLIYWCYILFFVTRIGAIRPLWVPVGAALFGLLAVYLHLEIQDTENQLADLKSMRYSFKKA